MNFKRIFTGVLCAAVAASSVAAPASAALKHSGYDLSSLGEGMGIVGEYFSEYVNGVRVRSEVRPTAHKWVEEGFETAYPHAGYSRLYAKNSDTKQFEALNYTSYNGLFANWETRFVEYDWDYLDILAQYKNCAECAKAVTNMTVVLNSEKCPHGNTHFNKWVAQVWDRRQTNIPGAGWKYDFGNKNLVDEFDVFAWTDADVHVPCTSVRAIEAPITEKGPYFGLAQSETLPVYDAYRSNVVEVKPEYKVAFVGDINVATGKKINLNNKDEKILADAYKSLIGDAWLNNVNFKANYAGVLNYVDLSARDVATGRFLMSDADIAKNIVVVTTKYVSGPTFDMNGKINGTKTVDLAKEFVADYKLKLDGKWNAKFDAEYDYDDEEYNKSVAYAMPVYARPATVGEISWTEPNHEDVAPFQYYQYLTVCGVVFNGENGRPVITRYLGTYAGPDNSWKLDY